MNNLFGEMNEKPFSHTCRYGTTFQSDRCDFKNGVRMIGLPKNRFMAASDVAEMIGFHATNIHSDLNGFAGYDTIHWLPSGK